MISLIVVFIGSIGFDSHICGHCALVLAQKKAVQKISVNVYKGEKFYEKVEHREMVFSGVIERQKVVTGPNTRAHQYRFVTTKEIMVIYTTPRVVKLVESWVGRHINVQGKIVDLSAEGFGKELWIGIIEIDCPE